MSGRTWGSRLFFIALWSLSTVLVAVGGFYLGRYFGAVSSPAFERAYVEQVIDGDTILVSPGDLVRYIGIDTPETVHPTKPVQCYGAEATARNRELVEGKYVELLRGLEDRDKYGRLLRYVFADGVFVNAELVAEGFAYQSGYGLENRFQQVFVQLEQYSILRKKGLWATCPQE